MAVTLDLKRQIASLGEGPADRKVMYAGRRWSVAFGDPGLRDCMVQHTNLVKVFKVVDGKRLCICCSLER